MLISVDLIKRKKTSKQIIKLEQNIFTAWRRLTVEHISFTF